MLSYRELDQFLSDGELEFVNADLCEPVESFTCRFCGDSFNADADLYRHFDYYGCGCVPEAICDIARDDFGIDPVNIRSWRVEKRGLIKRQAERRNWCGIPTGGEPHVWYETQYAVTLNGKTKVLTPSFIDRVQKDTTFTR